MLNEGAEITFIAKTTGLTKSQIKAIQSGSSLHWLDDLEVNLIKLSFIINERVENTPGVPVF